MSSESQGFTLERYKQVKHAYQKTLIGGEKNVNSGDIREQVIGEVAMRHISQEPETVRKTAVNKYFSVEQGSLPVLVDAVHAVRPLPAEMRAILVTNGLADNFSSDDIANIHDNLFSQQQPISSDHEKIIDWLSAFDRNTNTLARTIARHVVESSKSGGSVNTLVAKKGRRFADANRRSFREPESRSFHLNDDKEIVTTTKEYPTSVRAALYWAVSNLAEPYLTQEGKLKRPFLRIALHGRVKAQDGVHIAVAGGKESKGTRIVSPKVLSWFVKRLHEKISESQLLVDGHPVVVGIHREEEDETKNTVRIDNKKVNLADVVREDNQKMVLVKEPISTARMAGSGLGLENFRKSKAYDVTKPDGTKRQLWFNGLGRGFQTLQLELDPQLRNDQQTSDKFGQILAELATEFVEVFPDLKSLGGLSNVKV